jgi:predicted nucleic acid-binding protein
VILDTNALSAFADGDEGLLRVIRDEEELALPVIVLGEYLYGIHRSRRRAQYERWLADTVAELRLLVVGEGTAEHYASIRSELKAAGRPIPSNDVWIAALAREHRLAIVSRDQHFQGIKGLRAVSW